MNIKYQIPYNYIYGDKVLNFIYSNSEKIQSIYFGFENSCRTTDHNNKSIDEHINILKNIKDRTGIKLAYALNTVIPSKLSKTDKKVLDSGIVDIVIIACDEVFLEVYDIYGDKFKYELSRFYFYIKENKGYMINKSNYVAFGFQKEIDSFWNSTKNKNDKLELIYIVNENCFPNCQFKLNHNINQLQRNIDPKVKKFNCPYIKERKFYSYEDIRKVNSKNEISILKVCDRAFNDERLLQEFEKWINVPEKILCV